MRLLLLLKLLLQTFEALLAQWLALGVMRGQPRGGEGGVEVGLLSEHVCRRQLVLLFLLAQTATIRLFLLLLGCLLRILAHSLHAHHLGVLQLPHAHHVAPGPLVLHAHAQFRQHHVTQLVCCLEHRRAVLTHGRHAHLLAEAGEGVQVGRQ